MRKKLLIVFAASFIICVLALSLTACGESSIFNKKVNVTVYNNGVAKSYSFTVGETAKIDSVMKVGYYPTGFYDSETGGTKYFDVNGRSVSVWQDSYPTIFYAQYKSIDNYPKMEWHEYEGNSYRTVTKSLSYQLTGQDYYAVMGNLDRQIKLMYHFKAKMDTTFYSSNYIRVRFIDADGSAGEDFGKYYVRDISSKEYMEYFVEVTCLARVFHNGGKAYVELKSNGDGICANTFYYKECYLTATLL